MDSVSRSPTIDQIVPHAGSIAFDLFNLERVIPIANPDSAPVADILFTLQLGVASSRFEHNALYSPVDVRVYAWFDRAGSDNVVDLTPYVTQTLKEYLDGKDQAAAIQAYGRGMDAWLLAVSSYTGRDRYRKDVLRKQRVRAEELRATTPLSNLMTRLGDNSAGLRGTLHIANFLYSYINAPLLSLAHLLSEAGVEISIQELSHLRLVVSHGPCRLFGERNSAVRDSVGGRADVTAFLVLKNGLEAELELLERKLKARLLDIGTKLSINGGLQGRLTETLDTMRKVFASVESAEQTNKDIRAQLQAVQATTQGLLSKVSTLK